MMRIHHPAEDRVYIASPYRHDDQKVMEHRASVAREFLARVTQIFMPDRVIFYSPIAHNAGVGLDHIEDEFWREVERSTLPMYNHLWVLTMEGWEQSKGIAHERKLAERLNMPIRFIAPYENIVSGSVMGIDRPF